MIKFKTLSHPRKSTDIFNTWIAFLCHHIHELQTFNDGPIFYGLPVIISSLLIPLYYSDTGKPRISSRVATESVLLCASLRTLRSRTRAYVVRMPIF